MGKAFERLRRRWESDIKIGHREIGFDDERWMEGTLALFAL
jgi:hypothetical protein